VIDFIVKRKNHYEGLLKEMPERSRPIYEEENIKVGLKAKLSLLNELLEMPRSEWNKPKEGK
jgi:hypothetical protein